MERDEKLIRAKKQLKKERHDFKHINGSSGRAAELIAETPLTDADKFATQLTATGKGKLRKAFESISDDFIKNVVLHMPQKTIELYLDEKDPKKQQAMIDEITELLAKLDEAEEIRARLDLKFKNMDKVVTAVQGTINKLANADTDLVKEINGDIIKATEERKNDHPNEDVFDALIQGIEEKAGRLIGEERIASAKNYGNSVVEDVKKLIASSNTPADVIPYFTKRLPELEKLLEGTDALRIDDVAADIDAERVKRTDPVYRAKGSAVTHSVVVLAGIILQKLYGIKKMPWSKFIGEINTKHVKPGFEAYEKSMRRDERQHNQKDPQYPNKTYAAITAAALRQFGNEMKAIHKGEPDFERVNYAIVNAAPSDRVNTLVDDIQKKVLEMTGEQLGEEPIRVGKIKDVVTDLKTTMKTYLEDEGTITLDAENIVEGFFEEALEYMPTVVANNFYTEPEVKPEEQQKDTAE